MCSTRMEALGWRVGDRPLNRNGTEGGSGNPGVLLDVIERHKKKIKRSGVFKGSAWQWIWFVVGSLIPGRVASRLEVFIARSAFHTSSLAWSSWSCQNCLQWMLSMDS